MPDFPRRVLAVAAHPDDIEILCAGTMALYAGAGCEVTLCTSTNGDRGSTTLPRNEIGRIRKEEARKAAEVIGAQYVCLEYSDCDLQMNLESRDRFIDLVRDVKPEVVFTHDPNDYHSDHIATSKLTYDATFMASVPLLETKLPATHSILPLFYMDTLAGHGFAPEQYVDVSSVIETKRRMLACHVSQTEWMRDLDGTDLMDFMDTMTKFRGIQCAAPYAEAFRPAHAWLRDRAMPLLPASST